MATDSSQKSQLKKILTYSSSGLYRVQVPSYKFFQEFSFLTNVLSTNVSGQQKEEIVQARIEKN